jgi:DNA-binding PadR family transcriptional regulator
MLTIEAIHQYFKNPPPHFLGREETVCYVLYVLTLRDTYGTELIEEIEQRYPQLSLSDTVLYQALKQLESEGMVSTYWKKLEGRGRPRRMYHLVDGQHSTAKSLSKLWLERYGEPQTRA